MLFQPWIPAQATKVPAGPDWLHEITTANRADPSFGKCFGFGKLFIALRVLACFDPQWPNLKNAVAQFDRWPDPKIRVVTFVE